MNRYGVDDALLTDERLRRLAWEIRAAALGQGPLPRVRPWEEYEIRARGLVAGSPKNPCPVPKPGSAQVNPRLAMRLAIFKARRRLGAP